MKKTYTINEILSAVDEIRNRKKIKTISSKNNSINKDYSVVPKHTLKLIEEAEKTK